MLTTRHEAVRCLDDARDGTMSRCLALIERHAPRLMRVGWGVVEQEQRNGGRKLTEEERGQIVAWRQAGWSLAKIGERTGWSEPTISKVCRMAGLRHQARGVVRLTGEMREEIRRRRALGHPVRVVAAALGVSMGAIYRYQKQTTQ